MRLDLPAEQQEPLELAFREPAADGAHAQVREPEQQDQSEGLDDDGDHPRFHGDGV